MVMKKAKSTKNNGTLVRSVTKRAEEKKKTQKAKKVNSAKKNTSKKVKRA